MSREPRRQGGPSAIADRRAQRALRRQHDQDAAQLLKETTARARHFEVLHEVANAASGLLDRETLGRLTVNRAIDLLEAGSGVLRWLDATTNTLIVIATTDPSLGEGPIVLKRTLSAMARAFVDDSPQVVNDYAASRYVVGKAGGVRTMVAVPVRIADKPVGALAVFRYQPVSFSGDDAKILTLLASLVGPAIEAARLHGRLAESEARLREVHEAMACGVIVERRRDPVPEVNSAARAILGEETIENLIATGSTGARYTDVAGRELEPSERPWQKAGMTKTAVRAQTVGLQMPGGDLMWLFMESVPALAADGALEMIVTSFIDVTPLRTAEKDLALSVGRLREIASTQSAAAAEGDYLATLQLIADRALSLGGAEMAAILVRDGDLDMVYEAATSKATDLVGTRVPLKGTLVGRCVETGTVVLSNDLLSNVAFAALARRLRTQSTVMAPLFDGAVVAGVLRIDSPRRDAFGDEQMRVLELLAGFAATAIFRSRAQRALAESEALFKGAFEAAPQGISLVALDGHYLRVNRAFADLLGYTQEELLHRTFMDVTHPDDLDLSRQLLARLESGQQQADAVEKRFVRSDGRVVWAILTGSAVRNADGMIDAYLANITDITEERRAEAERIQVEARHAAIVNTALDCIVAMDAKGRITEWNPAAERTFGRARASVLGERLDQLIMPERFRRAHRRALAAYSGTTESAIIGKRVELFALRADGTEFPIELAVSRIEGAAGISFSASIRDTTELTERIRAQHDALESRQLLSKVVASAPIALFAFDADGRITLAEGQGLVTLGLDPQRAATMRLADLLREMPQLQDHFGRAIAGESSSGQVHLGSLDAWFDVSYEPVLDSEGRVIGMSVFAIDISDRVRVGRAQAENEARSKVMAVMNHEVRTPLNSVIGFTELLQSDAAGPLNEKQRRYVSNVQSAGHHLLALVNDSLDLSKMASGQMGLAIQPLHLGPLLEEVSDQLGPIAQARGLKLRVETDHRIWVRADHRRLVQVIYNLLTNAIKYSPAGAIITIRGTASETEVHIAVVDHGTGIPADSLERIFEEFVMLDSAREGTGLGLPVSRRLTQLMGGEISVVSEVGVGTTFTVHLPRALAIPVVAAGEPVAT